MDLALAYSHLDLSVKSISSLDFDKLVVYANTAPRNQLSFISVLDLPRNVKCTLWVRYVDNLPTFAEVSNYVTMDARIAWKPIPTLELSLVGQNLLEPKHKEFGADMFGNISADVERSMYGKMTWSF
jgi:iron complex outermembrane receptor protein